MDDEYPVQLAIDYPDRALDRFSTFLRIFFVIPIAIVIGSIASTTTSWHYNEHTDQWMQTTASTGGLLFAPVFLMLLFRHKYPRWWFDWNLEMVRFINRVSLYVALMDDRYPSTDDHQSLHLDFPYPDAERDLNRWMPLVKWFLAIPHYFVLVFLVIGAFFAVVFAWFAILFTGRYPRGLFTYVEGVYRWATRVNAYAFLLVTDKYPPFRLSA